MFEGFPFSVLHVENQFLFCANLRRYKKLEDLLEKSFSLVKMPSLQPVVMCVMKHLPKVRAVEPALPDCGLSAGSCLVQESSMDVSLSKLWVPSQYHTLPWLSQVETHLLLEVQGGSFLGGGLWGFWMYEFTC